MDQETANVIACLNSVAVSVEDLVLASDEVHHLPPEQRNWEGRTTCVARLFEGQHYKAFAVHSRLQAMAALIISGKLPQALVDEMGEWLPSRYLWQPRKSRFSLRRRRRSSMPNPSLKRCSDTVAWMGMPDRAFEANAVQRCALFTALFNVNGQVSRNRLKRSS